MAGRGGRTPGAGRKPKSRVFAPKVQAERVLERLGTTYKGKHLPSEDDLWLSMLLAQDLRIRLDALKYLTDRREGKPIQRISGADDGPVAVAVKVSFVDPND